MFMAALTAVAVVVGALVLLWGVQFVIGLLRDEDVDEAASGAAGQTAVFVGALFGVLGAGLVGLADVLDVVLNGIAASPVIASNLLAGLVGMLGLSGLLPVTAVGFGLLVVVVVGGVLVIRRARTA